MPATHLLLRHVWPLGQLPHWSVLMHPSDTVPQAAPICMQVFGVHPHWFGVPPPPHVLGAVQLPQVSIPPQPFEIIPHSPAVQVFGVHPQTLAPASPGPPPHVSGAVQDPQLTMPVPHPFGIDPQLSGAGHAVSGAQPQTLGAPASPAPPPHVSGSVHVPQLIIPPQPSEIIPQLSGGGHAVSGVQPQMPGVPPPPQVFGAVHVLPGWQQACPAAPQGAQMSSCDGVVDFSQ